MSINPMQSAHDAPAAKPNQNGRASRVVRPRCAAIASVGCMEPAVARQRGKGTAISCRRVHEGNHLCLALHQRAGPSLACDD